MKILVIAIAFIAMAASFSLARQQTEGQVFTPAKISIMGVRPVKFWDPVGEKMKDSVIYSFSEAEREWWPITLKNDKKGVTNQDFKHYLIMFGGGWRIPTLAELEVFARLIIESPVSSYIYYWVKDYSQPNNLGRFCFSHSMCLEKSRNNKIKRGLVLVRRSRGKGTPI